MQKKASQKILLLKILFTFVIVIYHCRGGYNSWGVFSYFNLIIEHLGIIALSFFFMLSAYLFYANLNYSNWAIKMKKRVFTLLIPLIVWNMVAFIYFKFEYTGLFKFIYNIFLSNYNGALWYISFIIILNIFSPLFYFIFKNKIVGLLIILFSFVCQINNCLSVIIPSVLSNSLILNGLFYLPAYFIGIYFAIHFKYLVEKDYTKLTQFSSLIFLFYIVLLSRSNIILLLSPILCWIIVNPTNLNKHIKFDNSYLFYIYASHGLFIHLTNNITSNFDILNNSPVILFFRFIITIIFVLVSYKILHHLFPQFLTILTGNRNK